MEKKLENISKLADDIVLTEQNERKLFIAYKKRIESQRRKKVLMRGYYRVAVVALAMMIMFSVNYYLQSPDLVVSCTHIPCNQVKTTLYGHAKVSPTECWVYTKRVIMCKCCGAALKSLSDWQFAYSHAPH